jgi:hypothetical protein
MLPRIWRLWMEPRPGSVWQRKGEPTSWEVWYVEGPRRDRTVVATPKNIHICVPLAVWRRWWLFAQEVQR